MDGPSVLCDNSVCVFSACVFFILGINRKNKKHLKYHNVLSTIKPVPHGHGIPVLEVTGDKSEMGCRKCKDDLVSI